MTMNDDGSSSRREAVVLFAAWLLLAAVVNPAGPFPLNDDWAYARSVVTWLETGELEFTDWGAMTLFGHVAWGAAISAVLGFSFEILRYGTLAIGGLGLLACLGVFRAAGFSRHNALWSTIVVAANPVFFLYAYSYMTDVPFFTVSLWAAYFWLRWRQSGGTCRLVAVLILLMVATLMRQVALGIGIGFAAGTLLHGGWRWRTIALAAVLAACPVITLLTFNHVAGSALGAMYRSNSLHLVLLLLRYPVGVLELVLPHAKWRLFGMLFYLGLCCLPVVLVTARPAIRSTRTWVTLVLGAAAFTTAFATDRLFPAFGSVFPFPANTLCAASPGPQTLSDSLLIGDAHVTSIPCAIQIALTAIGALSGSSVFVHLIGSTLGLLGWLARRPTRGDSPWLSGFVLVTMTFYFLPFLLAVIVFDRYVLLLVPLTILILRPAAWLSAGAGIGSRLRIMVGVMWLAMMAVYMVAGTHDYLSWNRARWLAAHQLIQERGVPVEDVDGGFEFNMWHRYHLEAKPAPSKIWWWQGSGRFMLSFGPLDGYRVAGSVPVHSWLPWGPDRIWVLEKK